MTPHLVLESALRASVLGLGAWGLLQLLRIRCPAQERVAWLGVLVAGAAMPVAATMAHRLLPAGTDGPPLAATLLGFLNTVDTGSSAGPISRLVPSGLGELLWALYLSVVVVLLARLGLGLFLLWQLWRGAIPLPALSGDGVRVRASCRVKEPVTIGAGILLPADWTQWSCDARDRVLTHEKSHFMRGDFFWQLLARAYLAVFWASPLSWCLLRRLVLLAEELSDDAALAAHGGPADYAALLLDFSHERRTACLTVGMARQPELSRRVERILWNTDASASRWPTVPAYLTGLLVLAAVSIAGPWFTIGISPKTTGAVLDRAAPGRPAFVQVGQAADFRPLANLPSLSALPAMRDRLPNLEPLR